MLTINIKRLCGLLPLLALGACTSISQQTESLATNGLLSLPSLPNDTVVALPDFTLRLPEGRVSFPLAHVSENDPPIPPVSPWRCGWTGWGSYPLQRWGDLKGIPHIKFTFLSSYQTWVPIEGKVYQHLRMRIDN